MIKNLLKSRMFRNPDNFQLKMKMTLSFALKVVEENLIGKLSKNMQKHAK